MTVYVDEMCAPVRRGGRVLLMCHMLADTTGELLAMADRIGVARRWLQFPGTGKEHLDICRSKRAAAIRAGAVPVTCRQAGAMVALRRAGLPMGAPETAVRRYKALAETTRQEGVRA